MFLPVVGNEYTVRANTHGPDSFPAKYQRGVFLGRADGSKVNKKSIVQRVSAEFEMYFPYSCFSLVPLREPIPARMVIRTGRR